jgi:parvulin-like peptidyl-prolyl isomerase
VRHILVAPEITAADVDRARVRADSVLTAVRGGASMATLSNRYNSEEDLPNVTRFPISDLPGDYATLVGQSQAGAVLGPLQLEGRTGARWAVIQITERQDAGPITIDDVREEIRTTLGQAMNIEEILKELRTKIYVSEPDLGPVRPSMFLPLTN